ncbi:MAG: tetraacyldisaccharide 4'-kinase [Magnetococcales bacterium]|nr:tetraacyldisaccharide 4'-kinase [Magnetococcales bacterium]
MISLLPLLEGSRLPKGIGERLLLTVLRGVGQLYGVIQAIRAYGYSVGLFSRYTAACPVISVGNLTAGGTGKTPMVLWLAETFQKKGRRVAVVSRGYRQQTQAQVTVVADPNGLLLKAPEAADEAVLIAQKRPGVTVITGPQRKKTIARAIQQFGCDLIIMDDGFQHLQVNRQLNLLLLDCQAPFGNGHLLPGGMLREFPSALERCDGVILTRADNHKARQKAQEQIQKRSPDKPICHALHQPSHWLEIPPSPDEKPKVLPLDGLNHKPVLAFCGIAKPETFQQTLQSLSLNVAVFQPFPDHHPFDEKSLELLIERAERDQIKALVCTEKDAVKIPSLPYRLPIYALSLELTFPALSPWLQEQIDHL